ncbi:MAG: hypothetical protein JSR45_01245 [Proteobacteria bacterium]|nr:hypothetical protein [Pseudomonadota bacterium]
MSLGSSLALKFAAAVAIAAAAALCVASLGYALYALLAETLTPASSAAGVALAAALLAGLGGWILFGLKLGEREPKGVAGGFTERLVDAARDRPLVAAAVAVGAGLVLLRNPALASILAANLADRRRGVRR